MIQIRVIGPIYRDFFIADYRALIDSFRVANPECRILIARLTPIADRHPRFESGTRDWHDEIQLAIETIAKYAQVQLIDFHAPLYPYPLCCPMLSILIRKVRLSWQNGV